MPNKHISKILLNSINEGSSKMLQRELKISCFYTQVKSAEVNLQINAKQAK